MPALPPEKQSQFPRDGIRGQGAGVSRTVCAADGTGCTNKANSRRMGKNEPGPVKAGQVPRRNQACKTNPVSGYAGRDGARGTRDKCAKRTQFRRCLESRFQAGPRRGNAGLRTRIVPRPGLWYVGRECKVRSLKCEVGSAGDGPQ